MHRSDREIVESLSDMIPQASSKVLSDGRETAGAFIKSRARIAGFGCGRWMLCCSLAVCAAKTDQSSEDDCWP